MTRRRLVAVILAVAMGAGGCALGDAGRDITEVASCITDTNLTPILATIRQTESGGNYSAAPNAGGASGAYQFIDSTWGGFGGYTHAADAPADLQDARAAQLVTTITTSYGPAVGNIPVAWYWPRALTQPADMDIVPKPGAGNVLTPRQYQAKWLGVYQTVLNHSLVTPGHCTTTAPAADAWSATSTTALPAQLACSKITWRGQANGRIPLSMLTYSRVTGYAHPAAAASWQQLAAAADTAGYNIAGSSYRDATSQAAVAASGTGAQVGTSCHGLGLAIDVNVLVPGTKYPTIAAVFASPEYAWLCNNASRYGWINPDWAHPAGTTCSNTGTGNGGGTSHTLEPWHWEAALIATIHPDFAGAA